MKVGTVRPDGTSTLLPAGVHDTSSDRCEITPEVEERVKALMADFDPRETKATFKLEVFFLGGPRKTVATKGIVTFFTNGGYLNGGGDAAVYLCPQPTEAGLTCMAPIDAQFVLPKEAICTKCRRISQAKDLIGQMVYNATLERWGTILVGLFHTLNCGADLVIDIERESLHKAKDAEMDKDRGGEVYESVYRKRERITYPLRNILQDTSSGAGLEARFKAFLGA